MSFNEFDTWQVTLKGTAGNQDIINRFTYSPVNGGDPYVLDPYYIAEDFRLIVLPPIVAIVVTGCVFHTIEVTQLAGGDGLYSLALSDDNVGLQGGQPLPLWDSFAFKSARLSAAVRSGQKRIGPLSEAQVTSGAIDASMVALAQDVADAFGFSLSEANGGVQDTGLVPVVRSVVFDKQPRLTPILERASTWTYVRVTSQVSRRD